jgi:hypothetical protein
MSDLFSSEYVYKDSDGNPVGRVTRGEDKSFTQWRRDDGRWKPGLAGGTLPLYQLPRVKEANADLPVFIVEGEKDCNRAWSMGLVATTAPGGASKPWTAGYSAELAGRHCVVIPDNDEPGKKHAGQVAASLHGVAGSVRVLELPELADKGDLSDWLDQGGSVTELLAKAKETPEWTAPAPVTLKYFHNIAPEPTKWIISAVVPEESCLLLGSEEKSGKTWLLLELAIALAAHRPALGLWHPTRQGTSLVVSPEGARLGLSNRLHGLCWGKSIAASDVGPKIPLWPGKLDLTDSIQVAQLRSTIEYLRPDLLMLDPLITMLGKTDENSSNEMQPLLDVIRSLLGSSHGMSIVVSHHLNKGKDGQSPWAALRGSSALGAWADGLVTIKRETEEADAVRKLNVWHRDGASPAQVRFRLVFDPSGGPVPGVPSVVLDRDC